MPSSCGSGRGYHGAWRVPSATTQNNTSRRHGFKRASARVRYRKVHGTVAAAQFGSPTAAGNRRPPGPRCAGTHTPSLLALAVRLFALSVPLFRLSVPTTACLRRPGTVATSRVASLCRMPSAVCCLLLCCAALFACGTPCCISAVACCAACCLLVLPLLS